MKINQKINFVEGQFDTNTDKMICIANKKYGSVDLCLKPENCMSIPIASVKLYSGNLAVDADAVFQDASNLGNEIAKCWNYVQDYADRISKNKVEDKSDVLFLNSIAEAKEVYGPGSEIVTFLQNCYNFQKTQEDQEESC